MTEQTKSKSKRRYARERKGEADAAAVTPGPRKNPAKPRASKIGMVVSLLQREEGATLEEMVSATGWQAHTARAALTGLRKKDHIIERDKRGDVTCYRIARSA